MEASEIRRIAREKLRGNWGLSILVAFIAVLLGGMIAGSDFSINIDSEDMHYLPSGITELLKVYLSIAGGLGIIQFILGGVIEVGYARFLLKQHDNTNPELNDLFSMLNWFGRCFLQSFLRGLYVFLWSLLFIIPGIIAGYKYAMTPFIMAENPYLSASEAIEESKNIMDGHKADLFWLGLTFIGWSLLCTLTLGIGYIFLNPYMAASYAVFYRSIQPIPIVADTQTIE